jgi:hypothetical protein
MIAEVGNSFKVCNDTIDTNPQKCRGIPGKLDLKRLEIVTWLEPPPVHLGVDEALLV